MNLWEVIGTLTISLAVIARNEETSLPVMLDSVRDVVDEIVIVDTGSTDSTVQVARRYTDRVYVHPWENSFAKARNYSLQYCTGDWILILDCDETLDPDTAKVLRRGLQSFNGARVLMPTMVMCADDGTPEQEFLCERIIRNGLGIRFAGDMHNWVDSPVDETRVAVPQWRIIHNRTHKTAEQRAARARQRIEMAESIFLPKIEQDPKDRRSIFYLAGTYYDAGMVVPAIRWLEEYVKVSDWDAERYQAYLILGDCYRRIGERRRAREAFLLARIDNWKRAEVLNNLGDMAIEDRDYQAAIHWFQTASLLDKPVDPMFVQVADHTWRPHAGLWTAYRGLHNHEQAQRHAQMAIEMGLPGTHEIHAWYRQAAAGNAGKVAVVAGYTDRIAPVRKAIRQAGARITAGTDPDALVVASNATALRDVINRTTADRVILVLRSISDLERGIDWKRVTDITCNSCDQAAELARLYPQASHGTTLRIIGDIIQNPSRLARLLRRPRIAGSARIVMQHSAWTHLLSAMEELGCVTDTADASHVFLFGRFPEIEPWMDGMKKVLWYYDLVGADNEQSRQNEQYLLANILPHVDTVLCGQPQLTGWFRSHFSGPVEHVWMYGYMPCFRKMDLPKQYDLCFCGVINDRRDAILQELGKRYEVCVLSSNETEQLNHMYAVSRAAVNMHYTDTPEIQTRIAEAMSAGTPVITERLPSGHPYPDGTVIECDDLLAEIDAVMADHDRLRKTALAGYEWISKEFSYIQHAERALEIVGL